MNTNLYTVMSHYHYIRLALVDYASSIIGSFYFGENYAAQ